MGYEVFKLQNSSSFPGNPEPTVVIEKGSDEWEEAYAHWINGENPTDSKEWKKGVIAVCQEKTVLAVDNPNES
jgi:hypothetical protein